MVWYGTRRECDAGVNGVNYFFAFAPTTTGFFDHRPHRRIDLSSGVQVFSEQATIGT